MCLYSYVIGIDQTQIFFDLDFVLYFPSLLLLTIKKHENLVFSLSFSKLLQLN